MTGREEFTDVNGQGIFEEGTLSVVKGDIERLSEGTVERVDDETP